MEDALIKQHGFQKADLSSEFKANPDFLSKLSPHELRLKEAADTGDFSVRGPLGQAFSREASKDMELMESYGKCKTWASKREFRA
eukprot:4131224-Alexandrium_andersonii.AAC.1